MAQHTGRITVVNEVPQELMKEACAAHKELISGMVGPVLESFLKDSINGKFNQKTIDLFLLSEAFKCQSARMDTQYVTMPEKNRMVVHVAFRDISYTGNDTFTRFRIGIEYVLDLRTGKVITRTMGSSQKSVKSRLHWGREVWE